MGSGGGIGAVELAKAGVGSFILVDFDRLKAHNITRHVCGLADVGRFKTRAVRDRVLQHNPQASVECHEADVTQGGDLLDRIAAASDLVFVATNNELSRYLINEACLGAGTPAVYGGVYERAFAGEVVRVIPGVARCYACVRQGLANTMRSISSQQVFDYTEDEELRAEPGLGLDVSFIALIHAKLALMTLLKGAQSALGDIDAEMVSIPVEAGNAAIRDGSLGQKIGSILEDAKPEAAYFTSDGGTRGAFIVVNMDDTSQMPALAEPWFLAFNATVECIPVMIPEDLEKGGAGIENAVKKYG